MLTLISLDLNIPSSCAMCAVCVQELVVHALKQTDSRSVQAAVDYISRNFQVPLREQIPAAAVRPVNPALKQAGKYLNSVKAKYLFLTIQDNLQHHLI